MIYSASPRRIRSWFAFVDYHLLFLASFFFIYVACVAKVTHLSAAPSQDVSSLDWSVHSFLSRVVKVTHLSVKMSHLWTGQFILLCHICCQGDPPFGSTQSRYPIFGLVSSFFYVTCVVKVTHLSAAPSQDVPSLDWFVLLFMSRVLSPWHTLNVHSLIHNHSFATYMYTIQEYTLVNRTRLFQIRIPYVLSIRRLL